MKVAVTRTTGIDRIPPSGIPDPIWRVTFKLKSPVTLLPGNYYFSHDVTHGNGWTPVDLNGNYFSASAQTYPGLAIAATGAGRLQVLRFGILPQVVPLFASYVLYRLETNIRAATILGFVGAGGIGFYIQTYLRMINYPAAAAVLLVLVAMIMAVDFTSSRLRARIV